MLVLKRKPDQAVVIGEDTIVYVLGVDRNEAKLGFKIPKDVVVLRKEAVGTEGKPHAHENPEEMLVLRGQIEEDFVIGDTTIKILEIDGRAIR